jgi:hypothetical protein
MSQWCCYVVGGLSCTVAEVEACMRLHLEAKAGVEPGTSGDELFG